MRPKILIFGVINIKASTSALILAVGLLGASQADADVASGEAKLLIGLDGSLTIEGGNVDLNGYSVLSAGDMLIADADGNANPFEFYLANATGEVSAGSLGNTFTVDGLLGLDAAISAGNVNTNDLIFEYGTEFGTFGGLVEISSFIQGTWANTGGGLWHRETDWSGQVPDGINSQAVFSASAPTATALIRIGNGGISLGSITVNNTNRINLTDLSSNGINDPITFNTTLGTANITVSSDSFLSIDNDVVLERDLVLNNAGSLTFDRTVSGAHSITSDADGVQVFDGALSHTGKTFINAGSYIVNTTHTGGDRYELDGIVTNSAGTTLSGIGDIDATIRIFKGVIVAGRANADIGTLMIRDGLFSGGVHYRWRFAETGADQLIVDGDLDLNGGVFRFVRSNNFDPDVGDTWVAIESLNGTINGTFGSVQGRLFGDKEIQLTYTSNQLIATVVSTAPLASSMRTAAVPEPSSLALLGLGGLLIARRRRA